MRIIETKVYQYDELNDAAKEKARDWYTSDMTMEFEHVWNYIKDDAKTIGLIIESLNDRRANKGYFDTTAKDCAEKIIKEHGETCDTYKEAQSFLSDYADLQKTYPEDDAGDRDYAYESELEAIEDDFRNALLEDYRIMLNKDCEATYEKEYVEENIRANEYEFTEEGKRA